MAHWASISFKYNWHILCSFYKWKCLIQYVICSWVTVHCMKCSIPLGCHGMPLHGFLEQQGTNYKTTEWQRSGWGTSTLLMSVKAASHSPSLYCLASHPTGFFRSMDTDQRKEEPSPSSLAWDIAANSLQNCTGCFAILFRSEETVSLSFLLKLKKTCSFHRTPCK